MTREELGREPSKELDDGYDPIRIARWAYLLWLDENVEAGLESTVMELIVMDAGPEFVLSESELRDLARELQSRG